MADACAWIGEIAAESCAMEYSENSIAHDSEIRIIGVRHGEKLYETLLTREEFAHAQDMGGFYRIPADSRDLNYGKYFEHGEKKLASMEEYNSENTKRLTVAEIKEKLLTLPYIREELESFGKK